jgi:hypothetical protein
MPYVSSFLFIVSPNAINRGPNSLGKADMDEIPMRELLELSPEARKEERMDPVCGQTKVTEPPPPPGVKVTDGLDVETHTANLRFDMILHFLLPRLVSRLERCMSGYATAVNTDLPDSVWGVSNEKRITEKSVVFSLLGGRF